MSREGSRSLKLEEGLPKVFLLTFFEQAEKRYKTATGVACGGFHPRFRQTCQKETKGQIVKFRRKGGKVWEMATSLHNGVFPESEERHERTSRGASAHF